MKKKKNTKISWSTLLKRSFLCVCPGCGKHKLFKSYITQVPQCIGCKIEWKSFQAHDGPAWLTIFLVGHILAPIMIFTEMNADWSQWISAMIWSSAALILSFLLLSPIKALFMTIMWRNKLSESNR